MAKQEAIIIDIDGTLTTDSLLIPEHNKWTREGKDAFYEEIDYYAPETMKTNLRVKRLLDCCQASNIRLIFVTAREASLKAKENTSLYLKELFGDAWELYMRDYNDFRPNYVVKSEIYEEHIKSNYEVLFVLEDEDNNINMFKSKGLQVLRVEGISNGYLHKTSI